MDSSEKRWLIIAIISVLLLIVLIIVPNIRFDSDDLPRLKIKNWGELSSQMPEAYRERVEEVLYGQVDENLANDVPSSGAEIRVETQRAMEVDDGLMIGNFIVDIPKIEQSYIIQYFYSDGSEMLNSKFNNGEEFEVSASVVIYCVTNQEDIIYPNFICKDSRGAIDSDRLVDVFYLRYLLPHTIALDNNGEAVLEMEYNSGVPRLKITVNGCENKKNIEEVEREARNWITDSGFNADNFTYNVLVKYDYCMIE